MEGLGLTGTRYCRCRFPKLAIFLASWQLCVFGLGLLQNGNVQVGIFPLRQKVFVGQAGFGVVTFQRVRAAKLQMRECADGFV
jgi:hypothetical protein